MSRRPFHSSLGTWLLAGSALFSLPLRQTFAEDGDFEEIANCVGVGGAKVDFSPVGNTFATTGGAGFVQVWDAKTYKPLLKIEAGKEPVYSVRYNPDGKCIVTASADGTARIFDSSTGKALAPALTHAGSVNLASFSADGLKVVTASYDKTAAVWDATTGKRLLVLPHRGSVWSAEFSPDGGKILTVEVGPPDGAHVWDATTGKEMFPSIHTELPHYPCGAFSGDGKHVAIAVAGKLLIIDSGAGAIELTIQTDDCLTANAIRFSPDGKLIGLAAGGYCRVWNLPTGKPLTTSLCGPATEVRDIQFSPDGRRILVVANLLATSLWQLAPQKELYKIPCHDGHSGAFSPDGNRLIVTGLAWADRVPESTTLVFGVPAQMH